MSMTREEILEWLTCADATPLFGRAREVRVRTKGNAVFLRGLIELSSICDRDCLYCGLRRSNAHAHRYAMADDAILACAAMARDLAFGTVVLQAGECARLWTRDRVAELVRRIKGETGQRVTLSLGERSEAEPPAPDLSGQPVTREGDTLTIGSGEPIKVIGKKELEITFTYQDEYQKAIQLIQLAEQTSQRKVG